MKNTYIVDYERACLVFDRLVDLLRRGVHPFDHSGPPQVRENMPDNLKFGGKQHALYLWMACYYMRGGIDSVVAFRQLTLIHERKSHLFDPNWLKKQFKGTEIYDGVTEIEYGKWLKELLYSHPTFIELRNELSAHGLGFSIQENTTFWILNALKLAKYWDSNPVKIFDEVIASGQPLESLYGLLIDRVVNKNGFKINSRNGFLGFQHKMLSMIAYFLGDAGLIDRHQIPVPVDFHVLRILVANGIIVPGWKAKKDENIFSLQLLEVARDVTEKYCREKGIDMVELCDSLWLFSRAMCSWHPDSESKTPEKSHKRKMQQKLRTNRKNGVVPSNATPSLGRKSKVIHVKPVWSVAQKQAFERSCLMCPIRKTCKIAIPAAPYYLQGKLVRRRRSEPKDKNLFDLRKMPIKVVLPSWNKELAREQALSFLEPTVAAEPHPELFAS